MVSSNDFATCLLFLETKRFHHSSNLSSSWCSSIVILQKFLFLLLAHNVPTVHLTFEEMPHWQERKWQLHGQQWLAELNY